MQWLDYQYIHYLAVQKHITVGAALFRSAIMTSSSLEQFAYVNTFALTSGLMYITMNILGIGFIASFSALPVVGFAAGCSWVFGASQLKYVFTVEEGDAEFVENMEIFKCSSEFSSVSIIITVVRILISQFFKRMPDYWDRRLIAQRQRRKDGIPLNQQQQGQLRQVENNQIIAQRARHPYNRQKEMKNCIQS